MARKPGIRILSFIAVAVTVTLYLELAPVPAASFNAAFSNQALAASLNGAEPSSADRFAFSSDGNLLASATDDGHIVLLSLLSGRQRSIGPAPFSASVADLSFSPDGKTLAGASEDAITLWDVRTGQERTVLGSTASVNVTDIAFSPDGKLLVGVADAARILVWDIATGFQLWTLPANDSDIGIAFSPDGQMLASSGKAKGITLWDMATGQELLKKDGAVTPVSFSPNGLSVASGGANSDITFWGSDSGQEQGSFSGAAGPITEIAFNPDGTMLASGGEDGQVVLWNVSPDQNRRFVSGHLGTPITALIFSPDGETLASVADQDLMLWDVSTGKLRRRLVGHDAKIAEIAFTANRQNLASVAADGKVLLWDLGPGSARIAYQIPGVTADPIAALVSSAGLAQKSAAALASTSSAPPLASQALDQSASVLVASQAQQKKAKGRKARKRNWKGFTAVAISSDGSLIGTVGEDSAVRLWNFSSGTERFALQGHHGAGGTGIIFSKDDRSLISCGRDSEIRLWNVSTGNQNKVLFGHEHPIRAVAASPDGKYLASAGEETRVMLWDAVTGKLARIFSGHIDFVNALAFSPDGTRLASAGVDERVLLWDVTTGKLIKTLLGHAGEVNAVAFSDNGKRLASASEDARVILWDAATGQQLRALAGHQAPVRSIAFSPGDQSLVSGGEDTRILVWDTAAARLLKILPANPRSINALQFLPSGRLISADENSEIGEWDLSSGRKIRGLRPEKPPKREQSLGSTIDSMSPVAPSHQRNSASRISKDADEPVWLSIAGGLLEWLVPAAAAQLPDPNQGPGGPILVVTGASPTFGRYYAEILRSEGLNLFTVSDISSVNPATLTSYDVVILAPVPPLSVAQVEMFTDWVNAGGNLIAMRPDPQLSGLLGISVAGATLSNAYLLVDTSQSPGNGIVGQTVQFHGTADRYILNGASSLAALYADATTATANPAITLRSIGSNGGQAAAFAYDLATSIVYTRQGNPLWAAQERDSFAPIRPDDKFYGDATGDPQPDWIDLNKVAIPQADEQQRLLANLILHMNLDRKPLPRFWYFPRGEKAVVIMTGDDHGNGGTEGRFNQFSSSSPPGCSVADWECVRGTSYIYPNTPTLTNAEAAAFDAAGFEVGLHVNTGCADFTPASLENFYTQQISDWTVNYASIPPPLTQRHHCITWSDWVTGANVQLNHGIRLDTSYYFWPPSWILNRPGLFTGSGMPMRFAELNGTLVDVYNATTQMTDESGQQYPFTINTLLDRALGSEGYYGAFTVNAHTDVPQTPEADAVVASALARSVPIVSSRQMLAWLDGRNNSSFGGISWSGNTLSFSVTHNSAANGLQALVPRVSSAGGLTGITRNGSVVSFTTEVIKGVSYAAFSALSGAYVATFAADSVPPTVIAHTPSNGATGVSQSEVITATFSEDMNPGTITTGTFELRGPGSTLVAATVTYNGASRNATLDPSSNLLASTTYTATVKGGTIDPRVKDLAGNAMASDFSWSFTTVAGPSCPCSGFSSSTPANLSASDPNAVELGVKFRSDLDGLITGIRFYKGTGNTGTHIGKLWTASGTQLATATFTGETATGWQQVSFATPVAITANTVYVASYHAPNGGYAFNSNYFASSGFQNGPLYFLRDGESGGNGVYVYGAGGFPTNSFQSANYWVDVVFTTGTGSDTTPPTVTSTTPASGATGVSPGTTVTAVFSEAMNATTINTATFELRDSTNALVAATVSYNANTATLTPTSPLTGSTTYTATVKGGAADPRVKDVAGNPLAANVTWSFTTAALVVCPCSGWSSSTAPTTPSFNDPNSIEVGVKFRVDVNGFISGMRFYKGDLNTGTHTGTLWTSAGLQLAAATFTNESASGWQEVSFTNPVAVTANTVYVASYHAPNGNYAADSFYFASTGVDNGPLHLLPDGVSGGNGVFVYSPTSAFPNSSFQATNYWVDVVFTTPDVLPPTITSTSPTNGATGVGAGTAVTATFSEAMDPATITTATIELRNPSNALVAATVSYDAPTRTATLTPSSPLAGSTAYTTTVKGGTTDPRVKDLAGNALAANFSWSFTTSFACPCSIWNGAATPANPNEADNGAVELGVKFTSEVGGFITGIRFYKSTANTGIHVGNLWSSSGQRLAQATFSNETASGWQQVNFATPVSITANTVYVASYHTNFGHYASDDGYFATSGVDNPPLHALRDGTSGANGVFVYNANSAFPTNASLATNYWVDVVFTNNPPSDTTPPVAPVGLTATPSASGITLGWTANAEGDLAGYHAYRSPSGTGSFTRLNGTLLTALPNPSYEDTLAPNGISDYRVTAVDSGGNESAPSATTSASMTTSNRILNPGFELDANSDTRPDSWNTNAAVTRSSELVRSGAFAMKHSATTNTGYTLTQVVTGLAAGTTYNFAGWVNIPATVDAFTFTVRVRWRSALNTILRTDNVKVYNASTNGWNKALASLVSPTGTTNAQVQMVVTSLNASIYVDDLGLR